MLMLKKEKQLEWTAEEVNKQWAVQDIIGFLDYYNITNDQNQPLDFKEHGYLWDIYCDLTPRQVWLKAAQLGLSTCANLKALWLAKNKGIDIIYTLPSSSDIRDFVASKTNRLIANSAELQKWTQDKDSIEEKRVGHNVIYYRGTWTERAAIAIPADLYICDEMDRSKQDIVAQYKTRLQHSKFGWEWYFSNPSAPGHGVDKLWQDSDQKHWFIKCEFCNDTWYLTMDSIMEKDNKPYFGCRKCKAELDRHKGVWVKKWKDKEMSGYWIPLLIAPYISASYILNKKKELSDEQFSNFVLGQPYTGKGNVLTKQALMQNLTDTINPQDSRLIIGVDTGIGINYVLGNKDGLFFYDRCEDYGPIRQLLLRYKNSIAVIDQGGDIIGPRKLAEEFKHRVFLCFFGVDRKNNQLIRWNPKDNTVIADRNKVIQLVVDEFTERRIPLQGTEADWYDYWLEWAGMYRTVEENAIQVQRHIWNKPSSGRCDYPFATVYWRIGYDKYRDSQTTFVEPSNAVTDYAELGMVASPGGTGWLPEKRSGQTFDDFM